MSSREQLRAQIGRIRALIGTPELLTAEERISRWSPAEHVDHLLKVSNAVIARVSEEDPPPQPRGISLFGRVILACGWIPRGRARAPARVYGARASAVELEAALAKLETAEAALLPAMIARRAPIVPHPIFRGLTASQALRFVVVHNEHHLRIVDEILRSSARRNASVVTSRPSA